MLCEIENRKQRSYMGKLRSSINTSLWEIICADIQKSEPKTWAAFCRRITAVYDFDKSKDIPVNKFMGELKKPPTLIKIADDGDIPF